MSTAPRTRNDCVGHVHAVEHECEAVIFDLFGTLVAAPSAADRELAVGEFAAAMEVSSDTVDSALNDSWRPRHDGRLRSAAEVAAHLVVRCGAARARTNDVETTLLRLASARLGADRSVYRALDMLRRSGVRLALLSDASPEIAECWRTTPLAPYFHTVVFSCWEGAIKPAPRLFARALEQLDVPAHGTVYCGDGGGDELMGAQRAGLRALRVARRGGQDGLAFGETPWHGDCVPSVEALPAVLTSRRDR
ncbi:HAD-IA family hydrolase [Streptomyces sp. NBC_01433]|uniref:HAD family hydrolase n=1 Tax=Streptomyces sp. NBC_01433 TaxID=2903864 RepID=UPI0022537321|nr:HAD-IA family hydrolase [Streptomyces sp. NBC_01433]MCX4675583.1 HAD-IA family hydrolase [Streptomyces sp. NBC_01433]